ncbi:MAG TPA: hypothetical protein GXZ82_10020 [Firmicutes bacterium]|nr:hypothetical protein [Bacillota bacterium]
MVNATPIERNQLKQFTVNYFTLLGAAVTEQGDLLRVELLPDQLAELEGRAWPQSSYWLNQPEEGITVLYLAFDAANVSQHEQAELVAPGSHRLEQMLTSARKHGQLAILRLVPPGTPCSRHQPHHPYLLFVFRIALEGQRKTEQLCTICIDMLSGEPCPQLLQHIKQTPLVDKAVKNVLPRQISFQTSWQTACAEVLRQLERQDDGWARESLLALAQERRLVDLFYTEQAQKDAGRATEWQERVAEAERRVRPRALIRTVQCALVLTPESIASTLN